MKFKFLSYLGLFLLFGTLGVTAAETVPYYTEFFSSNGNNVTTPIDGWQNSKGNSKKYWYADNKSSATQLAVAGATYGAMYLFDDSNAADAWLISPAISLKGETEYTVSFWARSIASYGEVEKFRIKVATVGDVSSLKASDITIYNNYSYQNTTDFEQITVTFTPDADGEYYFGLNCFSDEYQDTLFITGFKISDGSDEGGNQGGTETPGGDEGDDDNDPTDDPTDNGVVYCSDFYGGIGTNGQPNSSLLNEDWKAVNNGRGNNWVADTDTSSDAKSAINIQYGAMYTYNSNYAADAWLVSKSIELEQDVEYTVSVWTRTKNYDEKFKVLVVQSNDGTATTVATLKTGETLIEKSPYKYYNDNYEKISVTFTPSVSGEYVFGINCFSDDDKDHLYVGKFEISNGNASENPGGDVPVEPEEPTILEAPWAHEFTDFEEAELEKMFINENNGTNPDWKIYSNYYGTERYFYSNISSGALESDNYIATPYFHLQPGYYAAVYTLKATLMNYQLGTATDSADLAGSFSPVITVENDKTSDFTNHTMVVKIAEEGNYMFVIRHQGAAEYDWWDDQLQFSAFSIETTETVPSVATDFGVTGSLDYAQIVWRNPSVNNAGEPLDAINHVDILRDGVVIATVTHTDATPLTPGELCEYTDDTITEGREYTYSVEVYNANGKSEEVAPSVTVFAGHGLEANLTSTDFHDWVTINNDDDYYEWEYDWRDEVFRYYSYSDGNKDDYALTPYIELVEGKAYNFILEISTTDDDGATPEFVVGSAHDVDKLHKVADMALTLQEESDENPNASQEFTFAFKASTVAPVDNTVSNYLTVPAGNTVFGVHAVSKHEVVLHSYAISEEDTSGIHTVVATEGALTYSNLEARTSATALSITAYGLDGAVLATVADDDTLSLDTLSRGTVVVIVANIDGKLHTLKVVL